MTNSTIPEAVHYANTALSGITDKLGHGLEGLYAKNEELGVPRVRAYG